MPWIDRQPVDLFCTINRKEELSEVEDQKVNNMDFFLLFKELSYLLMAFLSAIVFLIFYKFFP